MNKCLNCGKETKNPKYCSKSCSAIDTNKKYPKRATKKKCIICGKKVKRYNYNRCEKHWREYQENKYLDIPIGSYRNKISVKGKHPSWLNTHIRGLARTKYKYLLEKPCANCGYSKHVELCHKKPISSFPDSASVFEVNSPENVIQLCRNCHWEFDHNILKSI